MNHIEEAKTKEDKPELKAPPEFVWVYTKEQVAACMQISIRTLEGWMKEGLIKYSRIGGTIRFRKEALVDAMLKYESQYSDEIIPEEEEIN